MEILRKFTEAARRINGTIVFPEGFEERTVEAAARLAHDGVCKTVLVAADAGATRAAAAKRNVDLAGVTLLAPSPDALDATVLGEFVQNQAAKGLPEDDARARAMEPLYFGALYVKSGKASGCVAGALSSTADVLRAAIYAIKPAPGTKLVSSFFLMVPPADHPVIKNPVIYADCGVNPDPGALGLKDIAVSSVGSFKSLFPGETARVAFLSFSTKGSAEHRMLRKILDAVAATREHFKDDQTVLVDGEMQFDAAVIPSVGAKKAPGSPVAGQANIFIFPDLNAGNICYKVTERLGRFTAIGPLIQGLACPMNDLSRGCSVDDIYYAAVIALLKSR